MTTELTWYDIPDFSRYEINDEGVVRIKIGQTEPYFKNREGEIIVLNSPDGPCPYYRLASDTQNRCVITQSKLIDLVHKTTD